MGLPSDGNSRHHLECVLKERGLSTGTRSFDAKRSDAINKTRPNDAPTLLLSPKMTSKPSLFYLKRPFQPYSGGAIVQGVSAACFFDEKCCFCNLLLYLCALLTHLLFELWILFFIFFPSFGGFCALFYSIRFGSCAMMCAKSKTR